jgi:hypothetical protein
VAGMTMTAGAVGMVSSFGRAGSNNEPGQIGVLAGGSRILLIHTNFESSGGGGCANHTIWVEYIAGTGGVITSPSGTGYPTQGLSGSGPFFIVNCVESQTLEIRFRLGSTTTPTGPHAADGYLEVRVNGSVQIFVTDIALGIDGYDGWDGIQIGPSGIIDQLSGNGGCSSVYANTTDTYGAGDASSILNESYATAADADLWSNLGGPWSRFDIFSGASTTDPALSGGKIVSNINYMTRGLLGVTPPSPSSIPPDDSNPCCEEMPPPGTPGTPGEPGNTPPPVISETLPEWIRNCICGGAVPTAADLVDVEDWSL